MTFENPNLNPPIAENKNSEDKTEKQGINESEINPELEKLREYSEIIFEVARDYESAYSYLEPMGIDSETGEPKSFDEEFEDFLEKRKTDPDYCPSFYYAELEKLDIGELKEEPKEKVVSKEKISLKKSLSALDEIEKDVS